MASSPPHSLPSLTPLPPLEMPTEISIDTLSPTVLGSINNLASFSPTPSFAESFTTARTSYTEDSNIPPAPARSTPTSISTMSPTQSLRKSISVDSFVKPANSPPPAPISQDRNRDSTTPGTEKVLSKRDRGHSSGHSNNNSIIARPDGGYYDPPKPISNIERSDSFSNSGNVNITPAERERTRDRHVSLKDSSRSRSNSNHNISNGNNHLNNSTGVNLRGGELPLPSRGSVSSASTSSMASTSASGSISSASGPPPTNRLRSGSMGATLRRRILVDTQVQQIPLTSSSSLPTVGTSSSSQQGHTQEVTLVVLGTAGCGKSTAIRKGLSGCHLSEPATVVVSASGQWTSAKYTRRVGLTRNTETGGEYIVHVIEIDFPSDAPEFSANDEGEKAPASRGWIDRFPTPNAVLVCYDASDEKSFRPVKQMLRLYEPHTPKLPIVVLACKSDIQQDPLQQQHPTLVDPDEANMVVGAFDTGIVEVGKGSEEGKVKMRRAFDWIFKALQRANRGSDANNYRNPASPDVLSSPAWENGNSNNNSRTATPVASSSANNYHISGNTNNVLATTTATVTRTGPASNAEDGGAGGGVIQGSSSSSMSNANTPTLNTTTPLPPISTTTTMSTSSAVAASGTGTVRSPVRSRSTGDLLYESGGAMSESSSFGSGFGPGFSPGAVAPPPSSSSGVTSTEPYYHHHQYPQQSEDQIGGGAVISRENSDTPSNPAVPVESKEGSAKPGPWATLDELLDKLLFLAISGDDPGFVTSFLLTYRRFAIPRTVLLAMQKRMRQLDSTSGDPVFACFAQMRICSLLEMWIHDYPHDFAVPRTAGALSALIKSIISKTYLLHYGSEFLPFLEMLPSLVDREVDWALKANDVTDEESDVGEEEDEDEIEGGMDMGVGVSVNGPGVEVEGRASSSRGKGGRSREAESEAIVPPATTSRERERERERERKSSVSLLTATGTSHMAIEPGSSSSAASTSAASVIASAELSEKQLLKDLVRLSQEVLALDSEEIAQEITRIEVKMFLDIKPRDWLQFTFLKKVKGDPVRAINAVSNRLGDWVTSLILCHKVPKARVKQVEKLVDIAQKLRQINNYSALRAFVAGINNSAYVDDEMMDQFKLRSPVQHKNFKSWDVLFQSTGSHKAYRMALKSSKGCCIPALEVHMADLLRVDEGNSNMKAPDLNKIHWTKYSMMGKFITLTVQYQGQCRSATDYNFPERPHVEELLSRPIMSEDMRLSMLPPLPNDGPQQRDTSRKLSFWERLT